MRKHRPLAKIEQFISGSVADMAREAGLTKEVQTDLGEEAVTLWRRGKIPTSSRINEWAKKEIKRLTKAEQIGKGKVGK